MRTPPKRGQYIKTTPVDPRTGAFVGERQSMIIQRRGNEAPRVTVVKDAPSLERLTELVAERVALVKQLGELREKLTKVKLP